MDFVLVKPPSTRFRRERRSVRDQAGPTPAPPAPSAIALPSIPSNERSQDVFRTSSALKGGLTGVNRRWSERGMVDKQGWLGLPNRDESLVCTVRNSSKHGALLELPDGESLSRPGDKVTDTFTLVWVSNRVRSEANCTIRWRSNKLVGINFIGPVRTSLERRG